MSAMERRASYSATAGTDRHIVATLRPWLAAAIARHAVAGGCALDVGCGEQPLRADVVAGGMSYVGVDLAQNSRDTVDHLARLDEPFPASVARPGGYQLILCTEVLEHVADWNVPFANFAAALAPGGRVILTCPHLYPPHEEPFDYWRPTPNAIERYARQAGLTVLSVERLGAGWEAVGTLLGGTFARPRSGWLADKALSRVANWAMRLGERVMAAGWFRSRVEANCHVALSIAAVLEKPSEPSRP